MKRSGPASARCAVHCGVLHFEKREREPFSLIKIASLRGLLSAASQFFGSLLESEAVGSGAARIFWKFRKFRGHVREKTLFREYGCGATPQRNLRGGGGRSKLWKEIVELTLA